MLAKASKATKLIKHCTVPYSAYRQTMLMPNLCVSSFRE